MSTLTNVTTRRGETNPPSIRFAPDAILEAKSSRTGVLVRYAPAPEEPILIDDIGVVTTYTSPLEEPLNKLLKRLFDILLSILFLLPTVLLLPFIAAIIKWQSPGPVFFRQLRTGIDGRKFYCYKFRSMHVNSDADRLQATKEDPRKFPFGNFMRKTNIDELPQFWNVLLGDMSIVGPRPHMLAHTEQYDKLIDG